MNKRVMWALVLIALSVIVLIFNSQNVTVDILLKRISATGSLVYLFFIGVGVVIGLLLK